MRITVISRSWPSNERSGVSLAAATHVKILVGLGHEVSIIGALPEVMSEDLPVTHKLWVKATGSGALYSKAKVDREGLRAAVLVTNPQLVLLEAWQTALTDASIEVAYELKIPCALISHGISLHRHSNSPSQWLRGLGWVAYRYLKLPRLIKKLGAITTLDDLSLSKRFFDRDLAKMIGLKVLPLKNLPVHWSVNFVPRAERKLQVISIGYFTAIKNQLGAIRAFNCLPANITLCLIGDRSGAYYESCRALVHELQLEKRIVFMQDHECNIAEEIANSIAIYAPSLTEALPITLLEAMACGTPFVATPVGAIPSFKGGISIAREHHQVNALIKLIEDECFWKKYSDAGRLQFQQEFSETCITKQVAQLVDYCAATFQIGKT